MTLTSLAVCSRCWNPGPNRRRIPDHADPEGERYAQRACGHAPGERAEPDSLTGSEQAAAGH